MQSNISLIVFIIIVIPLIVWFIRSKSRVKRLVVILTGVALFFTGMLMNRIDRVNTKIEDTFSFDSSMLSYVLIVSVCIIAIVYIEVQNKKEIPIK